MACKSGGGCGAKGTVAGTYNKCSGGIRKGSVSDGGAPKKSAIRSGSSGDGGMPPSGGQHIG